MNFKIFKGDISKHENLENYYLDLSRSINSVQEGLYGPFDKSGVPLVDYDRFLKGISRKKKGTLGVHYTPVTISEFALGLFGEFKRTGKVEHLQKFLVQGNWLFDNLFDTESGFSVWLHNFSMSNYFLSPPWVSAMAQGEGISVLLRMFQHTKDKKFLVGAKKALKAFQISTEINGVSFTDNDGNMWFEEFPTVPASHVLNGFIFALFGIFDLYRVTNDAEAQNLWNKGIQTLELNLQNYDLSGWSCYDLNRKDYATRHYHETHILQLEILGELTGKELFFRFSKRWRSGINRRFIIFLFFRKYFRGLLRKLNLLKPPNLRGISVVNSEDRES